MSTHSHHAASRLAAAGFVLGTLLYVLPSVLHGNPPIDSAELTLRWVADRPSWRIVHLVNILAVLIWQASFIALAPLLPGQLARITRGVFGVTSAVFAVYFSLHAFALPTLASRFFSGQTAVLDWTETVLVVLGSTAFTAQALPGLTVLLTGVALIRLVPAWMSAIGAVAGAGWLVGALLVDMAVVVPFTVLTWAWMLLLGALLLRRRPGSAPART